MRTHRSLVTALAGLCMAGCFVDQIDSAGTNAPARKPPPGAQAPATQTAAPAAAKAAKEEPGVVARLTAWWEEARKPAPDPNDHMVRCDLEGRAQFMLRSSCLQKLGKVIEEIQPRKAS